jgi:hypothetical protein
MRMSGENGKNKEKDIRKTGAAQQLRHGKKVREELHKADEIKVDDAKDKILDRAKENDGTKDGE